MLIKMQDKIKDFLEKKENNQLLIQRTTNLQKKLLQPVKRQFCKLVSEC